MATNRLPIAGQDRNNWGTILNNYLRTSLNDKGGIQTWTDSSSRPSAPDDNETGVNLQTGLFEQWISGTSQWVEISKNNSAPTTVTGGNVLTADSVAALKAINTTNLSDRTIVHLLGYYSPSDGGEGIVYLNKTSAVTSNDGAIFTPTTGGGRWFREINNSTLNTRQFGAKGDGLTDDTSRIQSVLDFANSSNNKTVYINPANAGQFYKISNTLVVQANITLTGAGYPSLINQTAVVSSTGQPNCINVSGSNVTISNINIMGSNTEAYNDASYSYTNSGGIFVTSNNIENITVQNCMVHNFYRFGISAACKSGVRVLSNFVYGNNGYGGDILVSGGFGNANQVKRTIVDGNYCLSNSYNTGIAVDQSSTKDTIITNNFIITLNTDGDILVDASRPLRRHGILVQYAAGAASNNTVEQRMIIANNFIRNTSWTGIYCNDTPVVNNVYYIQGCGPYLINGNFISDIGINGRLSDHDTGLSGGICLVGVGDGDVISDNILLRCGSEADVKTQIGALKVTQSGGGDKKITFSNNTIKDSYLGFGSIIFPHNIDFRNNLFINSTTSDISYNYATNRNNAPKSSIVGNRFYRGNSNAASIYINTAAAADPILITDNQFYGYNNAGTNNIAIKLDNNNNIIRNNFISNFYKGVTLANFNSPINSYLPQIDMNIFEYIGNNAIEIAGSGLLLLEGNIFKSDVVNPVSGGGRIGRRNFKNVDIFANSAPTSGTWSAGDRVTNSNPVSGQPIGWACTVAGTPGTWKSMGNLS